MKSSLIRCLAVLTLIYTSACQLIPKDAEQKEWLILDDRTASVHDRAIVVDASEFSNSKRLIKRLTDYASFNSSVAVARLTISSNENIVVMATRAAIFEELKAPYISPAKASLREGDILLAQVVCNYGYIKLQIRRGSKVEEQIIGRPNYQSKQVVPFKDLSIVSFVPHINRIDDKLPLGSIKYFIRLDRLPTLPEAEGIRRIISTLHPELEIEVVLRSDASFHWSGGPINDYFSLPWPDITESTFLKVPYILCRGKSACNIYTPYEAEERQRKFMQKFLRQ